MPDLQEVFQMSTQKVRPDHGFVQRQEFRQRRRMRNRKIGAYAMVAVIIAIAVVAILAIRKGLTTPVPADPPTPTEDLGIFAPVAGRLLYMSPSPGVVDRVENHVWAVDPNGPSDPVEGPRVADDVASTLVRLDLDLEDALPPSSHGVEPLGWSSDGTELLVTRWKGFVGTYYVVHADGTKTRVPNQSPGVGAAMAAISPDGSRVVFESQGLAVVDIEGGRAVKLPYPTGGEPDGSVTFSSDGTQIAYIANGRVWLVNADGTDAHEILADEPALVKGADSITWSPAGDRLAVGLDDSIYTFAPDGSDFAKVITDGSSPFWSPDGSQIAYNGPSGLAIADADGSNIRAFGFASSGPWHPGESLPVSPAVPLVWSPVQERDALTVHRGGTWEDPRDASVRWVDVTRVRYSHADNQPFWSIELAAKPPPPASREPGQLIAHGLVLDTTGDGVADYEVGIDNDAPQPGDFHVWITDLATGKTDEQIGPPYGLPIEFGHPHVKSGDLLSPGALYLTFLYGTAPADLDPATVRFYAWASASRDGKVFASDYAPDTGWMTRT